MADLHPEIQKFFDTHRTRTCACKRQAHDQLAPIVTTVHEIRAHVNELEAQLEQAELASHDHALDSKFEWMHTRLAAAKLRCESLRQEARALARVMVEVEECFDQAAIDLNTVLAIRGKDGTVIHVGPPAVPAVVEP